MTSDLFERDTGPRSVPAGHLAWLDRELAGWQEQGRIDAATAAGIRGKYTASRRFSLGRLLLVLGGPSPASACCGWSPPISTSSRRRRASPG